MHINTLRPRQDGRFFADDVLKCIFLNENVLILLKIPQKFVPKGPINNIPALVQIMAWHRPGDKPLSELMLVFVPTHIYMRHLASMSWKGNTLVYIAVMIHANMKITNCKRLVYQSLSQGIDNKIMDFQVIFLSAHTIHLWKIYS